MCLSINFQIISNPLEAQHGRKAIKNKLAWRLMMMYRSERHDRSRGVIWRYSVLSPNGASLLVLLNRLHWTSDPSGQSNSLIHFHSIISSLSRESLFVYSFLFKRLLDPAICIYDLSACLWGPMIELVMVREKGVLYEDQIGTVA